MQNRMRLEAACLQTLPNATTASYLECLRMVVDSIGIRLAPSEIEALAKMPTNVEELGTYLELTGYLRQFVNNYKVLASLLTDIVGNKTYATKHVRKLLIPWTEEQEGAFPILNNNLVSPAVLAFSGWNRPLTLNTYASSIGAGMVLTQKTKSKEIVIIYANHRFSRHIRR